ncbi:anthranilate synthase component II [Catenovulum adriaticum]|uniref:Aminodeoxychorismate/anthranilate synthase component II n=1 Tax=Catenovulum adriaticum TaxID=2984846 RepID=A0ABY7AJE2_9ALTE|nr:aminodeoxychorismate/anthranilate synthase component II [Catenovulum sp. TS8]WAJ69708.1 aminodeoxychorismate/anthranilate synthase component II [Catenovulum sp. TS8]
MLLIIDNYDSFTYNLAHYFQELNIKVKVVRNDAISLDEIEQLKPSHICISPGPCTPNESGISLAVIKHFTGKLPILGVCLGHQCIAQVFGAKVVKANKVMHGKTSLVEHNSQGLFKGIDRDFLVTRYHSLTIQPDSLPSFLKPTAWSNEISDKLIMGIEHIQYPVFGVQFHPESVMSEFGHHILRNFLNS